MKLEIGKQYVRRDGVITGPLVYGSLVSKNYPFKDPESGHYYRAGGGFMFDETMESSYDLVDEYPEQSLSTSLHSNPESRIQKASTIFDVCYLLRRAALHYLPAEESEQAYELVAELELAIAQPADEPLDLLKLSAQSLVDAAITYPDAMQYLNDTGITFIIRDGDQYHVTTNDGTYTINEAGFLFKQIKL